MNDLNNSPGQHKNPNQIPAGSPAGGTRGADHVFAVFRQEDTPFTKLMWTAAILQLVFFGVFPVFLLRSSIGLFLLFLPLPVLIALPFVLGILVRREFVSDVIPACRGVCTEKEIISGAMKSLRFVCFRYLLCLLPGILLFFILNRFPRYFVSAIWVYLLEIAVFLLGEYVLAWYPVARVFSRRAGMVVMMLVIFLAQIVLAFDFLYAASGLVHMDPSPDFNGLVVRSLVTLVVCAAIYGVGLWYFTRAAFADAGRETRAALADAGQGNREVSALEDSAALADEERESEAVAAFFGRKSK